MKVLPKDKVTTKNNVQKLREEKIWTIVDLAKAADVTPQTASKVERGIRTKRHSRIKVSKALGASYEEVFGEDIP